MIILKKDKYRSLIIVAVATLLTGGLFYFKSSLANLLYTNGLFTIFRSIGAYLSPAGVLGLWMILFIFFLRSRYKSALSLQSVRQWAFSLFIPLVWILILFYWLWGFNYLATRPEIKILGDFTTLDTSVLINQFQTQTTKVNQLRASLGSMDKYITSGDSLCTAGNQQWTASVAAVLAKYGYQVKPEARLRTFAPVGGLLRLGTAGFYNFLAFRPMVDPALHPLQIPNVCTHELAHAYGVSDEGSANFIAWLVCSHQPDTYSRYSTELSLWINLRDAAYLQDSVHTRTLLSDLSPEVKADLLSIRKQMDLYPDIAPKLRDAIYNLFLESQGVKEGIESYDRYLSLVLHWKKLHPDN